MSSEKFLFLGSIPIGETQVPIGKKFESAIFVFLTQFRHNTCESDTTIQNTFRPTIKVKKYVNQMKTDEMALILRLAMLSSEGEVERFVDTMYLSEF